MNSTHQTHLKDHLKDKNFWFDVLVLVLLWVAHFILSPDLEIFSGLTWITMVKITGLIGTIQLIGFLSFHLLGSTAGILIQGALGGVISSTATFIQFGQFHSQNKDQALLITKALLLAITAMLIECLLIIGSISPQHFFLLGQPILFQLLGILSFFFFYKPKKQNMKTHTMIFDDAIVWKKVFIFATLIMGLILLMRFLNRELSFSYSGSAFVMSLFEAHGVLAASLTELSRSNQVQEMQKVVFIILIGNVVSKTFLILRSRSPQLRVPLLSALYLSLLLSFLGFWGLNT